MLDLSCLTHCRVRTPVPLPLSPVAGAAARAGGAAAAATPSPLAPTPGPAAPTPLAVRESRPNVAPIAALNPYDTQWTIRAKVRAACWRGGGEHQSPI